MFSAGGKRSGCKANSQRNNSFVVKWGLGLSFNHKNIVSFKQTHTHIFTYTHIYLFIINWSQMCLVHTRTYTRTHTQHSRFDMISVKMHEFACVCVKEREPL